MERHNEEWVEEMKRKSVALKNAMKHLYAKGPGIAFKEGEELVELSEEYLRAIEAGKEEVENALNDLKAFLED